MTIIVSNYSGSYEFIHTEEAYCLLFIKLKYFFRGYRVWAFPTLWMANVWYKLFKKPIYKGTNITFEKYDPKKDQVTYYTPWGG